MRSGVICAVVGLLAATSVAHSTESAPYLADRGTGIATSMFGTFIEPGQKLVYGFYEYTRTPKFQYHGSELGSTGLVDYLGKLDEHEFLLFGAYGISPNLAVEVEGSLHTRATFRKAANDPGSLPATIRESGLGDVEGQLRWRWQEETAQRPEFYSFFEVVLPTQPSSKYLIGTSDLEGAAGIGMFRGFSWGTVGLRGALAYDGAESAVEFGEWAIEYIKRSSPRLLYYGGLEGESDEVSFIAETQWSPVPRATVKLNCGFGLTRLAPDIALEVGIMSRF